MLKELLLPRAGRRLHPYSPSGEPLPVVAARPPMSRVAYAAAHVVADPLANVDPTLEVALDWEATLAYRRHLWDLGLSVAEAMDTAQRGMGLDWKTTKELISRSIAEAREFGGDLACGAGTDHLTPSRDVALRDVTRAYEEQVGFVEGEGGRVVLMASRALAAVARGPEEYAEVYGRVLSQATRPAILHWLGEMFDPELAGYWGSENLEEAMDACVGVIREYADKVDGVKVSLLDADREVEMRRRLPEGVRMYTGDDFNYPKLILGDEQGYSHALLGIFDAIAPAASAALAALDAGEEDRYEEILAPTVPLSRHIFEAPTRFYKAGVVFMAYLNGHQDHFRMVGGLESSRSVVHLAELFVLADRAGLLSDPEVASERMRRVLTLSGVV
ncbi:MAG: dihydrodipicolinate synthase family protein [Rubrobacter sp.]|nr:dihydrodipicolinate synthase family protein [Rubrobacter sp.]